jgi:hypothetical protein
MRALRRQPRLRQIHGILGHAKAAPLQSAELEQNGSLSLSSAVRVIPRLPASYLRLCPGKPPPLRVELGKMSEQRRCCTKETAQERLRIEP